MTMIADYPTKKAFKEAVATLQGKVELEDPAAMREWLKYGCQHITLGMMKGGDLITVANQPKRSWFTQVVRTATGEFKVS